MKCPLNSPFSFDEIRTIPEFTLKKPSYVLSSDGVNLAYYSFIPDNPSAIVVFYHGGGCYINRTYQYIGLRLQKEYNIGCYCIDIRGHGYSEGPRGDAPSKKQVFEDVSTVLALVNNEFTSLPVYLVGHSSGAGILLNYSMYPNKKKDLYSGYILLAPFLGQRVGAVRPNAPRFVKKVRVWIYILNQLFKIPVFQHISAVSFNWPPELLQQDSLIVTSYSYTMSSATTPNNPRLIFEQLDKPCALYVGADDEQFIPEKLIEFAQYNKKGLIFSEIVPQSKHLSILVHAPELIAKAIRRF